MRPDGLPDDWDDLPAIELNIRSEEVIAKPRKLRTAGLPAEPSVVEKLAAVVDPDAKKKVEDYDKARASFDEMLADLRSLWE